MNPRAGGPNRGTRGGEAAVDLSEVACMIRVDGRVYCIDPAGGITDALGKKWTLPLIGILGNRTSSRFTDLLDGLNGVKSKALSDRLRDLQQLGVVNREVFADIPARVEYRLSPKGVELRKALVPLLRWADAERPAPEGDVARVRPTPP